MDGKITHDHTPSLSEDAARLSVAQLTAIDLLVQGKLDREAAEAAGVSRETVTRWRNGNAPFQAELNRVRARVWRGCQDHLASLVHEALDTLADAMREGDVRAAIALVKTARLEEAIAQPDDEQDAGAILWRQAIQRAERELALQADRELADSGEMLLPLESAADSARERLELQQRAQEIFDELVAALATERGE